jgi:mersacidin/lichenicidin family type 2 lantibiotic
LARSHQESRIDVNHTTRAWKDPVYRATLSAEALSALPANPVGAVDLPDSALEEVRGLGTEQFGTTGCCGGITARTHCGRTMCSGGNCDTVSYCSSYCGGTC